jgi:hypothetical protein
MVTIFSTNRQFHTLTPMIKMRPASPIGLYTRYIEIGLVLLFVSVLKQDSNHIIIIMSYEAVKLNYALSIFLFRRKGLNILVPFRRYKNK